MNKLKHETHRRPQPLKSDTKLMESRRSLTLRVPEVLFSRFSSARLDFNKKSWRLVQRRGGSCRGSEKKFFQREIKPWIKCAWDRLGMGLPGEMMRLAKSEAGKIFPPTQLSDDSGAEMFPRSYRLWQRQFIFVYFRFHISLAAIRTAVLRDISSNRRLIHRIGSLEASLVGEKVCRSLPNWRWEVCAGMFALTSDFFTFTKEVKSFVF